MKYDELIDNWNTPKKQEEPKKKDELEKKLENLFKLWGNEDEK